MELTRFHRISSYWKVWFIREIFEFN